MPPGAVELTLVALAELRFVAHVAETELVYRVRVYYAHHWRHRPMSDRERDDFRMFQRARERAFSKVHHGLCLLARLNLNDLNGLT